jgi:ribosomal-protein-alanine N-acetyltransferase
MHYCGAVTTCRLEATLANVQAATMTEPANATSSIPPIPRLRGQRVSLRPYRDDDADALLALYGDPVVTRWWSHEPWSNRQQAVEYLERMRRDRETAEFYPWAIASNVDDVLIGTAALYEIDRTHRRGMIGYSLTPSMQGHGYVHDALQLLIEFAWTILDLQRIEADTDPENTASRRLLERLGFTLEGSMRKRWFVHGIWHDASWYGLLREDYVA